MISLVALPGATAGAFHQQFFISIMNDVFAVLTDTSHKPGFKQQCAILQTMFNLVETGDNADIHFAYNNLSNLQG